MPTKRLKLRRLLDPRPAERAAALPVCDAVNIPLAELAGRMHELPPGERVIEIADVDEWAGKAGAWLAERGRSAICVRDFACGCDEAHEVGRLWEPTAFLSETIADLSGGSALELACGTGRDAVFLASCGWRVVAIDWLPDALQRGAALAARCADAIEPVTWRVLDLEAPDVSIGAKFDLVTIFRFLHRPLIGRLHEWLNPGGVVLYETFTALHRARHGKPAKDAHIVQMGELPELFAGYDIRHHSEEWRGSVHTARLVASLPA